MMLPGPGPLSGAPPAHKFLPTHVSGCQLWLDADQLTCELVLNGGFETYTGTQDDGTTDTHDSWTNTLSLGGKAEAATPAQAGSNALKVTAGSVGYTATVYQTVGVISGKSYTLTFQATGDGTNAGTYAVYDVSNSAYIVAHTSTGVTGTGYSQVSRSFTTPAGCVSVYVELRCPAAASSYAYYDAVTLVGTPAADGLVTSWLDRSANVWTPTQGTGSKQPLYKPARINGRPTVWFDGVDDVLALPAGALGMLRNVTGATAFAVREVDSAAAAIQNLFFVSTNASGSYRFGPRQDASKFQSLAGRRLDADTVATLAASTALAVGNIMLETWLWDATNNNAEIRSAGTQTATSAAYSTEGSTSDTASAGIWIGCGADGTGSPAKTYIAELIVYNRALAVDERQRVEAYLDRKYGWAAFVPTDFANCELWLRADRIVGLSDGDPVATWVDESGKGRDVSQANASAKPTYKTAILNGHPVVRFDGGDYLELGATAAFDLDVWTWLIVLSVTDVTVAQNALRSGYTSGADVLSDILWGTFVSVSTSSVHARDAGGVIKALAAAVSNNVAAVITGQWDAANQVLGWLNGTAMGAAATGADAAPSGHLRTRIGVQSRDPVAGFLIGDIAEVILYSRALSANERQQVERYLSRKYAIAVA